MKLNKIKKLINRFKYSYIKIKINCEKKWFGTNYGGFYLNPEYINEKSIIYSFWIGEDISFDLSIIKEFDCNVFGFDFTPKSIEWISKNRFNSNFKFYDFGIGTETKTMKFYPPKNINHVSGSLIIQKNVNKEQSIDVMVKSLKDIMIDNNHNKVDVLKLDIEGYEYELFESIDFSKLHINQILVEFHGRFYNDGKSKTLKIIERLSSYGFEIFAISNSYEEVSFINKNLFLNSK